MTQAQKNILGSSDDGLDGRAALSIVFIYFLKILISVQFTVHLQ